MLDDSAIKILTSLGVDISPFMNSMKTIEREFARLSEIARNTKLVIPAVSAADVAKPLTAQAALVQGILRESELKQSSILSEGEAKKSSILAREALARQKIIESESRARLLMIQQAAAQEKMAYTQAREKAFSEKPNLILRHASWFATGAAIFGTLTMLKEGLVDVETGMKGLTTVLPELHESQEAYNEASRETIDLMQKLGSDLDETMDSARSFGRMYKDVETVMGLTNNAILLNVIDQVALENAVKGNEVALSTYGDTLKSTNEVLAFSGKLMDSITVLSHNTLATGTDLVNILQQTSSAAKQAGTDLDQLLGLGSASIRATGLQGQGGNIGRMLRTVFTQLSAPSQKVEENINAIGVSMRETNGELKNAYDIILDLSLATKDASVSQEELNNAMLAAASGKFQYNKLAALVGQFDEIVKNTAMSINSQGQTLEMAGQQLDTIARKASMLKATLLDMFSGAGDSGLRETIKGMIDSVNQFIMGLNNLDTNITKNAVEVMKLVVAWKIMTAVYRVLIPVTTTATLMLEGLTFAQARQAIAAHGAAGALAIERAALIAEAAAAGEATVATNAFNAALLRNPIGLVVAGLSLLAGVALTQYISKLGEAEKAQMDFNQAQMDEVTLAGQTASQMNTTIEYLGTLKEKHNELTKAINSGKLSTEEKAEAQKSLNAIDEAVLILADSKTRAQLKANGVTEAEIQLVINSAIKSKEASIAKISDQKKLSDDTVAETIRRIEALEAENALWAKMSGRTSAKGSFLNSFSNRLNPYSTELEAENKKLEEQQQKANELAAAIITAKGEMTKLKHSSISDDGGSGGGGGGKSSQSDWLNNFLESVLAAAEAQGQLNSASQRGIDIMLSQRDLMMGSALTLEEYFQGMKQQSAMTILLEEKQKGLHVENELYRASLIKLNEAQDKCDTSTEAGRASYKKLGDEINRINSLLTENSKSWLEVEGQQRAAYGSNIKAVLEMLGRIKDLGLDTAEIEGKYLSTINLEIATLMDKYQIVKSIEEYVKKSATDAIKKQVKAIEAQKAAYDAASEARIANIQAEINALDEENDALDEQKKIQEALDSITEARNSLANAQTKISNVQNEKNTRIFQNGAWDYVANPEAVRDAQKDVDDANQKLVDAQSNYNDAITAINQKHYREELQAQIDAEKAKRETQDAYFDQQIKDLDGQTDKIVQEMLKGGEAFKEALTSVFKDKLTPELQIQLDTLGVMVSSWVSNQIEAINSVMGITSVEGEINTSGKTLSISDVPRYDSGGPIPKTGLALVHEGEYMLNKQVVGSLGGISNVDMMFSSLRLPSANTTNVTRNSNVSSNVRNDYGVNINKVVVPNVYDVSGLIRNLKQLALD